MISDDNKMGINKNSCKIALFGDFRLNNNNVVLGERLRSYIEDCEFRMMNFEAPITSSYRDIVKSGPAISQPLTASDWVRDNGFNIISLANNHIGDYGDEGIKRTLESFDGINVIGAGTPDNAYHPLRLTMSNGEIVSIITGTQTEFGCVDSDWSSKESVGAASITDRKIVENIISERKICDYVIVFAHAGVEYLDMPLPEWRSLFRHFVDIGCDAVIASHTHIPQGIEYYKGKVICYGLGNFCFQPIKNRVHKWWYNSIGCILKLCRNNVSSEFLPIFYDENDKTIDITDSPSYIEHLKDLNDKLCDDNIYFNELNNSIKLLLPHYYNQFGRSGLFCDRGITGFIKGFLDYLKKRPIFGKSHLINNLQCESHRWAIIRALRNKYNFR